MPGGLLAWYEQHAKATGRSVNAALVGALEEYRATREGGSTTPATPHERGGTTAPGGDAQPTAPPLAGKNCKHKNMKLSKGVCPDCSEWVTK